MTPAIAADNRLLCLGAVPKKALSHRIVVPSTTSPMAQSFQSRSSFLKFFQFGDHAVDEVEAGLPEGRVTGIETERRQKL